MCHFLTISVPEQVLPDVPDRFREKIYFSVQNNASINRFVPTAWISFIATSGGCSCDLYRDPKESVDDHERLINRYRKKGWSETKIQRALENRVQTDSHSKGLRDDVLELVEGLVKSHGELRLSLHWFASDIGTESFDLHDSGIISLDALKHDATLFPSETTIRIKRDGHLIAQAR